MKKWLLLLLAVCFLFSAGTFIFIPRQITINSIVLVNANATAAYRCLASGNKWAAWWPGTIAATGNQPKKFVYQNTAFVVERDALNAVGVGIQRDKLRVESIMEVLKLGNDSIAIQWQCQLPKSEGPLDRIKKYRQAVALKKNMTFLLQQMQSFLNKKENVYGIAVQRASIKDTSMVAIRYFSAVRPDTEAIYHLIKTLETYIGRQGAQETNYPMVHIDSNAKQVYETMVAIPVNKILKGGKDVFYKRMQISSMVATEVYGGPEKIKNAYAELDNYINDHQIVSPALSFESLVTNRQAVPDTTQWITKIYYPVF